MGHHLRSRRLWVAWGQMLLLCRLLLSGKMLLLLLLELLRLLVLLRMLSPMRLLLMTGEVMVMLHGRFNGVQIEVFH